MIEFGSLYKVKLCVIWFFSPKLDDENFSSRLETIINFCNIDQTFAKRTDLRDDLANGQFHARTHIN